MTQLTEVKPPVMGITKTLDEKRRVFIGTRDGDTEHYYIEFINGEHETRFILSHEAMDALFELRKDIDDPGPHWQVMIDNPEPPLALADGPQP